MNRMLLKVQLALLALGTAFSWLTLLLDYRRFFAAGGEVFALSGCAVTNPLATPCFYGALAFLAALVWAALVLGSAPEVGRRRQRGLRWLLAAGTAFAWGNFAFEVYRYVRPQAQVSAFSCPKGEALVHPLMTPCFYGALIYLAAFVLATVILRSDAARDGVRSGVAM